MITAEGVLGKNISMKTSYRPDGSSTRGGSTSVRGRVRNPHMAKLQAASVPVACGFFACFRFLIFHPLFLGGQPTPFAP